MLYKPWRASEDLQGNHMTYADAWAALLDNPVTQHDYSTFENKDMADVDWAALEAEVNADQERLQPMEAMHQVNPEQQIDIGQETGMSNTRAADVLGWFTPNPAFWPTRALCSSKTPQPKTACSL